VHARRGDFAAAERLALEGRRHLEGFSSRWRGEALMIEAEVLELAGKVAEAAAVFGEALDLYEDRRAVPPAERARTALERLNDRLAPAP
jgi:hypothetical protein